MKSPKQAAPEIKTNAENDYLIVGMSCLQSRFTAKKEHTITNIDSVRDESVKLLQEFCASDIQLVWEKGSVETVQVFRD